MKHRIFRITAVVLAALMLMSVLGACRNMNIGGSDDKIAAVFEGEEITLTEAKLYALMEQYEAESESADYISQNFGDAVTYWNTDMGGITMYDYATRYAVARMLQTKVLNKYAQTENITLTADEQSRLDAVSASFKEKYAKVVEYTGASDELIQKFLNENAVANKVYAVSIENIDRTLDPDEMLRKRAEGITIYASVFKPNDGSSTEYDKYTEEERNANLNEVYEKVQAELDGGASFEDILEKYADAGNSVTVTPLEDFAVQASEGPAEGEEAGNYKQLAWTLAEGETGCLKNDSNVYYVKCTNADDDEFRKVAETNEIERRKAEAFTEVVSGLNEKYDDFYLYEDIYAGVRFDKEVYIPEN